MSFQGDYHDDMANAALTDSAVDTLLEGGSLGPESEDLEQFIAAIRADVPPPRDVTFMAASLAATARSARPVAPRRVFRRLVLASLVGALVMAMAGVAVAANGSAPGDVLYGLDRTLEKFGLGDGGVDERIAEFDQLIDTGDHETAYSTLSDVIEQSDDLDSEKAIHHLELALTKDNPNAAAAQEKAAKIRDFIEANKGEGVGVDGAEFGQGVAEIARSETIDSSSGTDLSDQAGPKDDKETGPPANAGPKDKEEKLKDEKSDSEDVSSTETETDDVDESESGTKQTGPPDEAGPKTDKSNGASENAGPKTDK